MKKFIILTGILIVVLSGCGLKQNSKVYPIERNKVSVVGNMIYREGRPFAELRFFDANMAEILTERTWIDGLVIYYFDTDREMWIYPKKGLTVYQAGREYIKIDDMKRVWKNFLQEHGASRSGQLKTELKWAVIHLGGRLRSDSEVINKVYGVRISNDGKYIYYNVQGIIWDSSYKYQVEYGITK
ncbi:MAG: hypothetical protein HY879_26560 [Deltaproteobacteria bacterium]|nr:hypothetical protein [Deltaproteobacteria bacterium]